MASSSVYGKSIVVTGGLSGIGLAIVHHACVSVVFSTSSKSNISILGSSPPSDSVGLFSSLKNQYPEVDFLYKQCDVSSWEQQQKSFKEIWLAVGRIDLVFANAGISGAGKDKVQLLVIEKEGEEPQKPDMSVLDVNLMGTIYTVKLAYHYMNKNSDKDEKGHIICTASDAGIYPFSIAPLYGASKHGVVGLVRSCARQLSIQGIRINGLAPNVIETAIADEELFKKMNITPMSSLLKAVDLLLEDRKLNGQMVEIFGDNIHLRDAPMVFHHGVDENFEQFWALGHA